MLIEEYISGKEITVPFVKIFGKEIVLNPVELIYNSPIYNYKIKNLNFRLKTIIPAKLNLKTLKLIKNVTQKANKIIGTSYFSRLDIRFRNKKPYVIEINGEPTLCVNDFITMSAKSLGLSYPKLIIGLLANSKHFISYAKMENKKLYKLIKASGKTVALIK